MFEQRGVEENGYGLLEQRTKHGHNKSTVSLGAEKMPGCFQVCSSKFIVVCILVFQAHDAWPSPLALGELFPRTSPVYESMSPSTPLAAEPKCALAPFFVCVLDASSCEMPLALGELMPRVSAWYALRSAATPRVDDPNVALGLFLFNCVPVVSPCDKPGFARVELMPRTSGT